MKKILIAYLAVGAVYFVYRLRKGELKTTGQFIGAIVAWPLVALMP